MSRAEHLTPFDGERIRSLKSQGLSNEAIAEHIGRSAVSIWRVLSGKRRLGVWPDNNDSDSSDSTYPLEMKSRLSLEMRIGSASRDREADMLTAELVRSSFVDALAPHFVVRRREPDRFFADLTAALIDEGFSEPVLKCAARTFIRTRTTTSFPGVAACIAACRSARTELGADVGSTPTGLNSDAPSVPPASNTDSESELTA